VGTITVSKEDYLKAIFEAESEGQDVISATLTHWLSVSPPAVTMALRRLKRDGLVTVRAGGRVQLTLEGRRIARRTVTRHHLIERMLHEVFGMEWYKTHDEAERLEHAVSADFEAMLVRKLGRGGSCPHGNLATGESPAQRRKRGLLQLSEVPPGGDYTVTSVYERDRRLGEFLDQRAIRPGVQVRAVARNYDQTLTLDTEAGRVSLGAPAAEKVWVIPAAAGTAPPTTRNRSRNRENPSGR
jgi:DtxR family Mn-dependent transcriptional regulator